MKGQMFIVSAIFLVIFIFIVQQILFQYSALDTSAAFARDDFFVLESVVDSFNDTIRNAPDCPPAVNNTLELLVFYRKQIFKGGFNVHVRYNFSCTRWGNAPPATAPLKLFLQIEGIESETSGNFSIYNV